MKYILWICSPEGYPFSQCFFDQANPLREAFVDLGHECEVTIVRPSNEEKNVIIFAAHLIRGDIPKSWIVYNMELILTGCPWLTDGYVKLLRNNPIWDFSERNIASLAENNITAKLLPIAYHFSMTKLKNQEKTIDILHYGSMCSRRDYILNLLARRNVNVSHACGVFGDDRDKWISKSKIVINMGFYENSSFNITRCGHLFANRVPVVSEIGIGSDAFHSTGGFAKYDDLVEKCLETLTNPEPVGDAGYNIFSKTNLTDSLCSIL